MKLWIALAREAGWGHTLLLGILTSGRPVVASSGATTELGQMAEQAGLRVEPGDGAGFAAAIRRLVGDGPLRRQRGQAARQLVEQRYGQETVLGDLENQLMELHIRPCRP